MRFSLELPVTVPADIPRCAAALDGTGFDACFVTDHPAPSRRWLEHGGHATLDPFVALSLAAAVTTRLRLHTHCLVPAYRHPLLTAKAAASLDAASGGRLILGVAVGYLEAEFAALGVPFGDRARRFDDALAAVRAAWAGDVGGTVVAPRPARPLPLWVGGNSPAAMRRAVAHGTGWAPFPASRRMAAAVGTAGIGDLDALARAITRFRNLAAEAGRGDDRFDICFTPFSHPAGRDDADPGAFVAEVRELAALGVTWVAFHLAAPSLDAWCALVRRWSDEVLPQVRA
jgi:probable F420-dependent oxidoreductase